MATPMRRPFGLLVQGLGAVLLLFQIPASAAVDQEWTPSTNTLMGLAFQTTCAQTFTCGADGILGAVGLRLTRTPDSAASVVLDIRPLDSHGEPVDDPSAVLFAVELGPDEFPLIPATRITMVDVSAAGIRVRSGDRLAIAVTDVGPSATVFADYDWWYLDGYGGGQGYVKTPDMDWFDRGGDYIFETHVNTSDDEGAAALVSNLSEPEGQDFYALQSQWFAAPFVTDSTGHTFSSVTFRMRPDQFPYPEVSFARIYSDSGHGTPGEVLAELVNPALPGGVPGNYEFFTSFPVSLSANTRYYACLGSKVPPPGSSDQQASWWSTTSRASTGPGTLPGGVYFSLDQGASWQILRPPESASLMFRVSVTDGFTLIDRNTTIDAANSYPYDHVTTAGNAVVDILPGGVVGGHLTVSGESTVNFRGGTARQQLFIAVRGTLQFFSGSHEGMQLLVEANGTMRLYGGTVKNDLYLLTNGTLEMFGGTVGRLLVIASTNALIKGGAIGAEICMDGPACRVELVGTDMAIRNVAGGQRIITGVLEDGTDLRSHPSGLGGLPLRLVEGAGVSQIRFSEADQLSTVDQDWTPATNMSQGLGVQTTCAQTFTCGLRGTLEAVSLRLARVEGRSARVVLEIRPLDVYAEPLTDPSSALVSVELGPERFPNIPSPQITQVDVSSAKIHVETGDRLAIVVTNVGPSTALSDYDWSYLDGYAAGQGYVKTPDMGWFDRGGDYIFRTTVRAEGEGPVSHLVSNFSEPEGQDFYAVYSQWFAAPFVTDSTARDLSSVTFRMRPDQFPYPEVSFARLYTDSGRGSPGALLAELENPALPWGVPGDYEFLPSSPVRLKANTRYYACLGSRVPPPGEADQRASWWSTISRASTGPGTLPGGVYFSSDQGGSWQLIWPPESASLILRVSVRGTGTTPTLFLRGDADGNGSSDLSDAIFVLRCVFLGEECPTCADASDSNDDGSVDISDPIYNLNFQFLGGPPPDSPYPQCGTDGVVDELDCRSYPGCP